MVEVLAQCKKCGNEVFVSEFDFCDWNYCPKCGCSFAEQGIDIPAMITVEQEKEKQKIDTRAKRRRLEEAADSYRTKVSLYPLLLASLLLISFVLMPVVVDMFHVKLPFYESFRPFFGWFKEGRHAFYLAATWISIVLGWLALSNWFTNKKFPGLHRTEE